MAVDFQSGAGFWTRFNMGHLGQECSSWGLPKRRQHGDAHLPCQALPRPLEERPAPCCYNAFERPVFVKPLLLTLIMTAGAATAAPPRGAYVEAALDQGTPRVRA